MFYEEDEVNSQLRCSNCQKEFDEPKCLPCCGEVVCLRCIAKCLDDPESNEQFYKCVICQEKELMPRAKTFATSKRLLNLLKLKPKEVYRSELVVKLQGSLKQMNASIEEMNCLLQHGKDKIAEYFSNIRNDIQLQTELCIQKINVQSESLLKTVCEYEKEATNAFIQNEPILNEKQKNLSDVLELQNKWKNYLKQTQINDSEVANAIEEYKRVQAAFNNVVSVSKNLIFDNNIIRFAPHPLQFNFLGSISKMKMDNSVSALLPQNTDMTLQTKVKPIKKENANLVKLPRAQPFQFESKCDSTQSQVFRFSSVTADPNIPSDQLKQNTKAVNASDSMASLSTEQKNRVSSSSARISSSSLFPSVSANPPFVPMGANQSWQMFGGK